VVLSRALPRAQCRYPEAAGAKAADPPPGNPAVR